MGATNDSRPAQRRRIKKTVLWIGYGLLLAIVSAATGLSFLPGWEAPARRLRQARLTDELGNEAAALRRSLRALDQQFETELAQALPPRFQPARAGAQTAAERLSGFGTCAGLCWQLAMDRLNHTGRAERTIRAALAETVTAPCVAAQQEADRVLIRHMQRVREADARFRSVWAGTLARYELPTTAYLALQEFGQTLARREVDASRLATGEMTAAFGVALEAALLRTTFGLIDRVTGRAAARMTGSLSGGMLAAAADGPLPIGDAVGAVMAVGGMTWSAYDVYQAKKVLPAQLRNRLLEAVDSCETQMKRETLEKGRSFTKQSEQQLAEFETSVRARLGEKP